MKNEDVRRENARLLAQEAGGLGEFAKKLGVKPAYVSQILGRRTIRLIGNATARNIEKCFAKPDGWLDTPHTVMLTNVTPVSMHSPPLRVVPLLNYGQAKRMLEEPDPYALLGADYGVMTVDADVSSRAFALEIQGDSMEPIFTEGDRVVIDPSVKPLPGDFVVARDNNEEATFLKYRPRGAGSNGAAAIFELVPLNADYPTLRSDVDHLAVIGTMVEHRRYRRR